MKYLNNLTIINTGPIEKIEFVAEFDADGNPKPIVFIGKNGSGKTILLSTIVDAIHEFARGAGFNDVTEHDTKGSAKYFRVSGGGLLKSGAPHYLCGVNFESGENDSENWTYFDKGGVVQQNEWEAAFHKKIPYPGTSSENLKRSNIGQSRQPTFEDKAVFLNNTFCYFPANRGEIPFWQNSGVVTADLISDGSHAFNNELKKPIICSNALKNCTTWLMDTILDSLANAYQQRINIVRNQLPSSSPEAQDALKSILLNIEVLATFNLANQILSVLLGQKARFAAFNRKSNKRLCFTVDEKTFLHISQLSHGQASLLGIFLTVIRYSDSDSLQNLSDVKGVVVIDEADAGLHIEHQTEVLPNLMKLMPKVQFILTTHSPLLLLGLEKKYDANNVQIVSLPDGRKTSVEDFSEFQSAYQTYSETLRFKTQFDQMLKQTTNKPILHVEGKTDETLIRSAWEKLRGGSPFPFEVRGKVSCKNHTQYLKELKHQQHRLETPNLFLWDFDKAFDEWNSLLEPKKSNSFFVEIPDRSENQGLVFQAKDANPIFGALLPVPNSRSEFANRKWGGQSRMYIELLFEDDCLGDSIEKITTPGGGYEYKVVDTKVEVAEKLTKLPAASFVHFEPLIKMLEEFLTPASSIALMSSSDEQITASQK